MDSKLVNSSEKIKIKEEKSCFNDYCSEDACEQIDVKEELIKPEYDIKVDWHLSDHDNPSDIQFIAPEDVKGEDSDVSSTIESLGDPIRNDKGLCIIST